MAAILCLDFDDTLVFDNTSRRIFERFGGPAWREAADAYAAGRISVEQYNAAALDTIDIAISREELAAFALEVARPRPGLLDLYGWAQWNGWQVLVVSNGFDFSVDPVLDQLGMDRVARHCGRTMRAYRWRVRYPSPRGIELQAGFKLSYAAALRDAGDFVAYAGDGASDIEAARLASVVFARDTLLARLAGEHPRLYPFETFDDVREVLDREAEGWLAAFEQSTGRPA